MDSQYEIFEREYQKWSLPHEFIRGVVEYSQVLMDINERVNLTGAKTEAEVAGKHVLDTYLALKTLERVKGPGFLEDEIYDVGSGGGIPGILLAIFRPNTKVFLVERRTKKAGALREIVSRCQLSERVQVIDQPFELIPHYSHRAEYWFRGFLPGPKLIQYFSHSFPKGELKKIVLMKGPLWDEERRQALCEKKMKQIWQNRFENSEVLPYSLPESLGSRNLVLL